MQTDLEKALREFAGARGVVVDLRGSAPGPIATSVALAGLLLPADAAVLTVEEPAYLVKGTEERDHGVMRTRCVASGGDRLAGTRVVALVDESASGSAAVILAAWHRRQLRSHDRACGGTGLR